MVDCECQACNLVGVTELSVLVRASNIQRCFEYDKDQRLSVLASSFNRMYQLLLRSNEKFTC